MKPCISVSYTVAVDTFYPTTATELSEMLGAASTSTLQIQFSRTVKYETVRVTSEFRIEFAILQEDYIVKQVDLLSGFGGAVGLWLGWAALTLGHFLVQTVKTLNSVTIFK